MVFRFCYGSPRRKEAGGRGAEGERPAKPDEERDPFGFFDLKNRVKGEKQAQDEGTAPPEVKVFRNKYMRRGAEKGPRKERVSVLRGPSARVGWDVYLSCTVMHL